MENSEPVLSRYVYAPIGMYEYLVPLYPVPSYAAITGPSKIVNIQNVVAVYKSIYKYAGDAEIYEYVGVRIEPTLGIG